MFLNNFVFDGICMSASTLNKKGVYQETIRKYPEIDIPSGIYGEWDIKISHWNEDAQIYFKNNDWQKPKKGLVCKYFKNINMDDYKNIETLNKYFEGARFKSLPILLKSSNLKLSEVGMNVKNVNGLENMKRIEYSLYYTIRIHSNDCEPWETLNRVIVKLSKNVNVI